MNDNYNSNNGNTSGEYSDNTLPNYQQGDNSYYQGGNGGGNMPPQQNNYRKSGWSRFLTRIIIAVVLIGVFYGVSMIINKTSLFNNTHTIAGVSVDLPSGYGPLTDGHTLQSGSDDSSFSNDNVSIYVMDNELNQSTTDIVYSYLSMVSADNLELISSDEITVDGQDSYYIEYGSSSIWTDDTGVEEEAYCAGIALGIPNDDCVVIVDMYSRRGEKSRNLLSDNEMNRFLGFAETIVIGSDTKNGFSDTTISLGSKMITLPIGFTTYEPDTEVTLYGTNYFLYAADGYRYIDFYDYSMMAYPEEDKKEYLENLSPFLIEPMSVNGDKEVYKYFDSYGEYGYGGVIFIHDEYIAEYYWLTLEEPTAEQYEKAAAYLSTIE